MKNYTIKPYSISDFNNWNDFVSKSNNGTFLHNRNFMEYHSDRFKDYSLIVLDDDKWIAVLPANIKDNQVFSHQGLTYGGLIYNEKLKIENVIDVFKNVLKYLFDNHLFKLNYKSIPKIYYNKPTEEIEYLMFLLEAKLLRCDCLSIINLQQPFIISKTRKESMRRGIKNELIIKEDLNFDAFWNEILIPNLNKKHNAKPVHSLEEIKKLNKLFPENIRHYNVYYENKIVAGSTIFITNNVTHPQYISGQEDKNQLGSLDFLYNYLITEVFKNKKTFDFGPSHEQDGKKINQGILFWKESFGASTITQKYYEIETSNFELLENILI